MSSHFEVGNRRELFVNKALVDTTTNVSYKQHEPIKREIALQHNEAGYHIAAFYNLFQDGDKVRMYYRGFQPGLKQDLMIGDGPKIPICMGKMAEHATTNYAESTDGIHFEKPNLGICEWNGNKDNNIVLHDHGGHNFCVFRDDNPDADPSARYKAIGGDIEPPTIDGPKTGLIAFGSPDGLHWRRLHDEPMKIWGMFDSLNVPMWDRINKCYRVFSRITEFRYETPESEWPNYCRRDIQSCTSKDFINWTPSKYHSYSPDDYDEEYYTNATQPCPGAEHILLSFPMRYVENRKLNPETKVTGICDTILMASRDGHNWTRYREAYVRPDLDPKNWTDRNNMMASGIIQTSDTEWSLYISEHYRHHSNRLRRLSIRPWGFVSLNADAHGGEFATKPMLLTDGELRINYETSAIGSIQIEVQEEDGTPIAGHTTEDMEPVFGNSVDGAVSWKDRDNLQSISGKPVRLKFKLKDADVYGFRIA